MINLLLNHLPFIFIVVAFFIVVRIYIFNFISINFTTLIKFLILLVVGAVFHITVLFIHHLITQTPMLTLNDSKISTLALIHTIIGLTLGFKYTKKNYQRLQKEESNFIQELHNNE